MFSFNDIIDIAIKIEENGERFYRETGKKISSTKSELASLLKWLSEEEHRHIKWFEEFRKKAPQPTLSPEIVQLGQGMLQNIVGDQCFSLDDIDMDKIESLHEMIYASIELEEDTVLFYNMIGGFIEDQKTLSYLMEIIKEEQRHAQALREFLPLNREQIQR